MLNTTNTNLPSAGKTWTQADEEVLVENYLKGLSSEDIGELLGRTATAIRSRLVKICFPDFVAGTTALAGNSGAAWTDSDDEKLAKVYESEGDLVKLAELLGRKPHELLNRLVELVIAKPVRGAAKPPKANRVGRSATKPDSRKMPKSWTKDDRAKLRDLFEAKQSIDVIARALDRSVAAVLVQLFNGGMLDEGDIHAAMQRAQSRTNWAPPTEQEPF